VALLSGDDSARSIVICRKVGEHFNALTDTFDKWGSDE